MIETESYISDCKEWLRECFVSLTDELIVLKPSEWAEEKRYLPRGVTDMPGQYSFDIAPYLIEPLDCLSPDSPIREIDIMKGVQIGATVGIIENSIGYAIDHIQNSPMMMLTATDDLAKQRLEVNIIPMLHNCNIYHLLKANDDQNTRRTGVTNKRIEWEGGGFLIPQGANSAGKLRSTSIQILLEDEVDSYKVKVGKDGKPNKLAEDRTAAYEQSRKIVRISTPLITQTSVINHEYLRGDQRKYHVPCRHCNELQELVWSGKDPDGNQYGIKFDTDEKGNLIEGSVVYICKYCKGKMTNDDKLWMYREKGKYCKWIPTAKPMFSARRSYHMPSFLSPVGMQTWETQVRKWLECWDIANNKPRDLDLLQQFYNNVLGVSFEMRGESPKLETVIMHRRPLYNAMTVPNDLAQRETGGDIQILTCAVDVHKRHLDILVQGWCRGGTFYAVDYYKIEGNCHDLNSDCWNTLRDIIENKVYHGTDGKKYRVSLTLVDAGYERDLVCKFCYEYSNGVFPILGRQSPQKNSVIKEFSPFATKIGIQGFYVTTSNYKDRLSIALSQNWDGASHQPLGHPNYPADFPEYFFKELTSESKREKINPTTRQSTGFFWYQIRDRENHAWDLSVYNYAALEMVALDYCKSEYEIDNVEWSIFWDDCANKKLYFDD